MTYVIPAYAKYKAIRTYVDGIKFDSQKEAMRYSELRLLEKGGQIHSLEVHPVFKLHVKQKEIGKYIADFAYKETSNMVYIVEDTKGYQTELFKWKKKHFEAEYGIKLQIL